MFRYKQGERFRVIVEGVSFFTTAKQIRQGVGDSISVNSAVQKCLASLEDYARSEIAAGHKPTIMGLGSLYENLKVQITRLNND